MARGLRRACALRVDVEVLGVRRTVEQAVDLDFTSAVVPVTEIQDAPFPVTWLAVMGLRVTW